MFPLLSQNLHCCDNNSLNKKDKSSKIRPKFEILNKKFIDLAPREENHSIDKSMVPYYGRHSTKQYFHGKPIRWGYNIWTATTINGFIEWFEPYQVAKTMLTNKKFGVGGSVVLQFADLLQNKDPNTPYSLYFDNYLTSLWLLKELSNRSERYSYSERK